MNCLSVRANRCIRAIPWPITSSGGWQLNGIAVLRSGQPYNLTVAGDLANTGNSNYLRPNVVGDWHVDTPTRTAWFNKAAFAAPGAYTFGNMGRNRLRSDWARMCDLSVFRQFPLWGEKSKLEFRTEAFNVFNKQIYAAPTNAYTSSTFGQVDRYCEHASSIAALPEGDVLV